MNQTKFQPKMICNIANQNIIFLCEELRMDTLQHNFHIFILSFIIILYLL